MNTESQTPPSVRLLVVAYLVNFDKSQTLNSIRQFATTHPDIARNFSLTLWDNSPVDREADFNTAFRVVPLECGYISTTANICLSKIYNSISNSVDSFDYLCILDQDSEIGAEYFLEAARRAAEGVNLALPRVITDGFLFSPSRRRFCLGGHFESLESGERSSRNMLAINSGMLVRRAVFQRIRYDERLCFYGTDTWFMVQYARNFRTLYVMDAKIRHSLRFKQENSVQWRKSYYREQIRVNAIIYDGSWLERLVTGLYGLYLRVFYARR